MDLSDNAAHILIVDDDQRIRDQLAQYLFENGFRVTTANDATCARASMRGLTFDLVLLDVMMPGESGLDLARDLKTISNVPICMLTARAEAEHRVEGLEIGVDDFVPKPFEPRELVLRLRNILRRGRSPSGPRDEIKMGDYVFHVDRGELKRGEESIKLTERERDLLRLFAQRPGLPVARHELASDELNRQRACNRCADQPTASQDRARPRESHLSPDRAWKGLYFAHRLTHPVCSS